jgi:hypothetical protein
MLKPAIIFMVVDKWVTQRVIHLSMALNTWKMLVDILQIPGTLVNSGIADLFLCLIIINDK